MLAAGNPQELGQQRNLLARLGRMSFEQRCELVEASVGAVVTANACGMFKLADDRKKSAVLVQGRPEIMHLRVRLVADALLECPREARLSDPWFATEHYDMTLSGLRLLPMS
jgi:hypothetical protein